MPKVSKRSKKMDQKYISRAEYHKDKGRSAMDSMLDGFESTFERTSKTMFGAKWWTRLQNTAEREKMSPLAYMLDKLSV